MHTPHHHIYMRKTAHKHYEPYPATKKFKRLLDTGIYIVGVVGPLLTLPQLKMIWIDHNIQGIAL